MTGLNRTVQRHTSASQHNLLLSGGTAATRRQRADSASLGPCCEHLNFSKTEGLRRDRDVPPVLPSCWARQVSLAVSLAAGPAKYPWRFPWLLGPPSIPDRGPSPHERDPDRYPEVRELRSIDPVWHSSCRQPGINAADKPLPEGSGGPIDPARQPKLRTFRQNARPQRVSPSFTARGRDGMLPGTWVPPFDSGGLLAAGRPSHAEHAAPSPLRKRCTWRPRSAVGRTSHWRLRRADECCKPQNISNLLDTSSGDSEMAAPAEPHNLSCSRARRRCDSDGGRSSGSRGAERRRRVLAQFTDPDCLAEFNCAQAGSKTPPNNKLERTAAGHVRHDGPARAHWQPRWGLGRAGGHGQGPARRRCAGPC